MTSKISLNKDLKLITKIGSGVSSDIYKSLRFEPMTEFTEIVAVKIFKSSDFRKKFHDELENLSKIRHPNVVDYKRLGCQW